MPLSQRVGPLGSIALVLCLVAATVAGSADGVAASPESPSAESTTTESVAAAATAVFAASASVTPRAQYLGETGGRVFTFTIANTGSRDGIGAVAINRPGKFWTIKKCPKAPAGWTKVRSRTSCRYRSAASRADDIAPGATSSAFRVRAANRAGDHNITGTWPVVVSRSNGFDTASKRTAGASTSGGLTTTAYSFQVLRVVIDPGTTTPGAACPTSTNKTAVAGSVGHTFVVCGRNRSNRTLTPIAAQSSLGGTFVAGHGGFHSGPVAPSGTARILGSWTAVTITAAAGTNKTVVALIGSARNRTSPLTTLSGYRATVGVNVPPVAVNDATTMAEDNPGATIDVLANDTDANADTLSVTAVDTAGTAGQVTNNGTNVSYDPNGAFDALGSGDTATDTFGYTVSDGHGGTDTATVTVTITGVATANTAPVAVNDVSTVSEDDSGTTIDVLANDTDANSDALSVTAVDTSGTAGQVTNNGTNVTYDPNGAFEALAVGDTATDTFAYTVSDGHGGTDVATVTVTINGLNDAPVIGGIEVGPLAYVENAAATQVTATGTVVDVDSANFSTGTLTVDFSVAGQAEDRLEIRNQGTAAGQISVSGANVSFGGVPIGTFTGGTGVTPLVITLNASATPAAAQALVRNITYRNVSESPSTATRTARFVLTDGDGGTGAPATRGITVASVDDAPVAVNDSATVFQGAAATAIPVLANDTDIDGGPKVIASAGDPANGTVVLTGGSPGARTGLTYQPDLGYCNDPPILADTFSYTLNGGNVATVTMTVTCVAANDPPVALNDGSTVSEDSNGIAVDVLANDTDPDTDPLSVSAIDTTGTAGLVTNNGTNVSYDPNGAFESLGAGSNGSDTFSYTVSDGKGGTDTATVTITVNGVNDVPTITGLAGGSLAYVENDAATVITGTGTVADVDSATFDTGTLTVDFSVGGQAEDRLEIRNQGTGAGQIGVAGANVSFGGATIGTFTGGIGTAPLVITLNANATPAAAQALVRNITYRNVSEAPSTTGRTARFVVTDGDGGTSSAATRAITVAAANDAPAIANLEAGALAYVENAAATPITAAGTVSDPDSANFATGTLTVDYSAGGLPEDRLEIRNQGTGAGQIGVSGANVSFGGVTIGAFVGGSGTTPLVITLSVSATPAAAQALVRNITYRNVSETPSTATRTARFVLTDGDGGTSAPATRQITVAAVNDPPVAVNDAATIPAANGATAIAVRANDTDADNDTLAVTAVNTTGTTGLVVNNGTNVTYNPNGAFGSLGVGDTAIDTFAYTISDGNGGTDTATVTVTITGADEAPVLAAFEGGTLAYVENAAATPITATGTVTDIDSANFSTGALTVDFSVGGQAEDRLEIRNQGTAAGQIGVSGANVSFGGVLIGTFTGGTGTTPLVVTLNTSATAAATQALVRNITYRNVSDGPSVVTRTARFVLSDGDGGTSAPVTRTISVTAANDAPVVAGLEGGALAYVENAAATPITATGTVTDVDSANFSTGTLTVDFSVAGQSEDRLEIRNQGTAAGQIGVSGANVSFGGVLIGTFAGGTGTTPLVVTLNTSATPAATQALVRNITYRNVSETPSTATRTVRFVLTDGDGGTSAPATRTITVAAVDDAPVAVNDSATVSQGAAATPVPVLANDTDVDGGPKVIASAGDPANGTVVLTGGSPGAATGLTYQPDANYCNDPPLLADTFTYTLNGGSAATVTMTVTCVVNAAPVIAAIEAGALPYAENAAATPITATGTVTDSDSANFSSGTLTVDYSVGGLAEDRLEIRNQGTAAGQIGVAGSNVTFGGVTIGVFAGGTGTSPLVITLNASAASAATQALLRNITYRNVSEDPSGAARTVRFVLTDGDGGTSTPATRGVTVTPANDAPVLAAIEAGVLSYTENAAATPITATGTVTDADSANFSTGTLTADFSAGGQTEDRLAIRNQGSAAGQIGVSGANVNFGGVLIGTFTGGTGTTPLVVTLNASATPAAVQALARNITYANVSENPSVVARTARFVITDGDGGSTAPGTRGITVSAVNDAPVVAAVEAGALAYTEGAVATPITATGTVADADSANFDTGALTVDFSAGGLAEDRLEIRNQGVAAGQIGVSAANVTFGGVIIGTFVGGTGTTPLVVTLNASATPAATQALVRNVTYRNVSASPSNTPRTARFVLSDGDGGTSAPASRGITVNPVLSAPVVTTSAGSLAFTEGAAAQPIDPALTVTDSDSTNLAGATVQVTGNYVNGQDLLAVAPQLGITGSFDAPTGKLTLTGTTTVANYQTVLRTVTYGNSSDAPSTLARTVTFIADDGSVLSVGATKGITVAVTNDAPAIAAVEAGALAYTENAAATPITATGTVADPDSANFDTGTLTIDFSVGGQAEDRLAIRNQGAAAGQIGVSGANVNFGGVLLGTFAGGTGTTPLVVTLNATATPAATQALLRNITYANVSDTPSVVARTARFVLTDGDGGTSSPATRGIAVTAVNDVPVIAAVEAGALAYVENAAATPITATGTVADLDSANFDTGTLTIDFSVGGQAEDRLAIRNQGVAGGQIGVSGANVNFGGVLLGTFTGGTGTTPLVVSLNATATPAAVQALLRNITYANVSEAPSVVARTARFVVTDGDGGTSAPATRQITVAAVDDAPAVTSSGGNAAYTEQNPATVIDAAVTATDVDGPNPTGATVTIVSPVAGDTLSFVTLGTITGSFSAGVMTLSGAGTIAEYQAALRTVQFSSTSDNPGPSRVIGFRISTPTASNTSNKTITITQVNDPPVVNLDAAGGLTYTEQAGFQNLFGPAATVVDPDSATLASLKVTVTAGFDATFDVLRLNPTVTGFTPTFVAGVLTLTKAGGTVAEYQNALRNVQVSNTDDDPDHRNDGTANPTDANRTVSVVIDDGGVAGLSSPVNRNITITPVNDAPSAPTTLPTSTAIRNTTMVIGLTATEPHVTRTAVNFVADSVDPDGPEANIALVPAAAAASAQGGRVTLAANGNLRYEPPASGTLASDTYGYSLTDGAATSTPYTFTINLSGAVWYVADQAPLPRDGTAARPFDTVAAALTAAPAGQAVHIRRAPGDGILSGPSVMEAGDKLIGEGVALTNVEVGSATPETLFAAGTKPVLTAAAGTDVVTLATNAQVAGVSINPDGAANGLFGTATAGVVLRSMDVTDTGAAATQPGIELTGAGNGLTFTAPVTLSTTQAGALNVTGAVLAGTLASTSVTGSTTSPGVSLTNTTGSLTFTTVALTTTGQPGFVLNNADAIDVNAGTVAATGGPAVDAIALDTGSDLTFTDTDSTNSTADGINLDGAAANWTFSTGSGSVISGAAGIGFDVNGGTGAVTYPGSISASGAGKGVDVSSRAAATTFSGNITGNGGAGITVTGNTAGTTTFSGATKSFSTTTSPGVTLTSNTGSTVSFINALTIVTTTGAGFAATGGGTVSVVGAGKTIQTGTGTALNVSGTTIAASGLTFQRIAADGAVNGILLANTGSAAGLTVTGTGAVDSGGVIANTTGVGVSLLNTDLVSLNNVRIQGANRSGVQGVGVTGFSYTNGTIANAGDSAVDDNDSSIAFNTTAGGMNNNVDGAVTITNNTLSNAFGGGVDIFQYAGTISNAVITGNTISSTTSTTTSKRSGIALNLFGSASTVASLTTANIANNTVTGFPSGEGITIQGANTASAAPPAGTYGIPGTGNVVAITGNQVIGDATNKMNGFGIAASVTGVGQGNFSITNNGTVGSPLRNMKSSAVAIGAAGNVTAYFVVTGNQINANNGFGSSTIGLGIDKNIQADLSTLANPVVRATITGNSVANSSGTGIRVLNADHNGSLNLRVDNNNIPGPVGAGNSGISVENGSSGNPAFNPTLCASIANNTTVSGPANGFGDKNPGISLYKATSSASTFVFGLTGLAPSPATAPQTEAYVTTLNPNSELGAGFYAGKKVSVDAGTNFTSCTLPPGV